MLIRAGKLFVSGFLVVNILTLALFAERDVISAENAQFEIVGLHARSVSYVEGLSQHVVEVSARYLDRAALRFPQRILVSLKPEEYVDFEGEYNVRVGERGFVNLDIRWQGSLSLLTTCQALSEALLIRYSLFNYGESGPDVLPQWPAVAIGTQAYLSLRPAQSTRIADWMDPAASQTLASLLQRRWNDPAVDANGYALLLAMVSSGIERGQVRSLMSQSIAGVDIQSALAEAIQSQDPVAESPKLDDWWRASFAQLFTKEEEFMETMADSRQWIGALADFSDLELGEFSLKKIWEERENEEVRDLIEARYELLKLRIIRVNPAYFNAARSLGALYETYLLGDRRHKYMHRLTAFLSDFEDAKVLEEAVIEALEVNED